LRETTEELRLGSGRSAERLGTPQFEGELLRLGRAVLPLKRREQIGGYRPRKFVGNDMCLGRDLPVGTGQRSAASRAVMPTLPSR
jgi:hypothetical protein